MSMMDWLAWRKWTSHLRLCRATRLTFTHCRFFRLHCRAVKARSVPVVCLSPTPGKEASVDRPAMQLKEPAMQGGQSSRLYQALVRDKQLVQSVGGFADEKRGTGAFYTSATIR